MDEKSARGIEKKIGIGALFFFILLMFVTNLPTVKASPYKVEIQVRGTSGLEFSGSYGDTGGQKSVDGTVPETYTIEDPEGNIVSCTFQKQQTSGTLTVKLVKDGEEKKSKSTTAEYGVVSLSATFEEEGGCFIATATYGSEGDEGLKSLRDFRDDVLLTNEFGEFIVNAYYETSPPIADSMRKHDIARIASKFTMVIPASIVAGAMTNGLGLILLIASILALLSLSYRIRRVTAMLKGISAGIFGLLLGIGLILSLGWLSFYWSGFAIIAVYTLPLVVPGTIVFGIWILKEGLKFERISSGIKG